uniref:DH domain-containing protein n=1 Tax=Parascaris univalens TaxID=6257 RepID=A0A915B4K9_PARUN
MKRSISINNLESIIETHPLIPLQFSPVGRQLSEELPRRFSDHIRYRSRSLDSLIQFVSPSNIPCDAGFLDEVVQNPRSCPMSMSPSSSTSSVLPDEEKEGVNRNSEQYLTVATDIDDAQTTASAWEDADMSSADPSFVCRLIRCKDLGFDETIPIEEDSFAVGEHKLRSSEQEEINFHIDELDAILEKQSAMLGNCLSPSTERRCEGSPESPTVHVSFAAEDLLKKGYPSEQTSDNRVPSLEIVSSPVEHADDESVDSVLANPTISGAVEGEPEDPAGSGHVDKLLYDEESVCGTPHILSPVSERREESSSDQENNRSREEFAVNIERASAALMHPQQDVWVDTTAGTWLPRDDIPTSIHRRWLSDHGTEHASGFKEQLEDQLRRENEVSNDVVRLRRADARPATLSSRCRSQLVLGGSEPAAAWLDNSSLQISLSSSSPSVNDTQDVQEQQEDDFAEGEIIDTSDTAKLRRDVKVQRSETQKWAELMPATFGAHQVIGPVQRPSRLVPNLGVVGDSSAKLEGKARLDKKQARRASGLLDFFPSYRKKRGDLRTPPVESNLHGFDRRSTVVGEEPPIAGLPDSLIKALQERPSTIGVTDGRFMAARISGAFCQFDPQINKPKWADLELWRDDPPSWSSCNAHLKLNKQERKKQDLIYEVYLTEKHYCQMLVILQQVYQEGLRVKKILSEAKRAELIPQVLDALLDFHLNLLRRLQNKRNEAAVVDSISQIVYSEFEKTALSQAAVNAYTEMCSKKDQCGHLYDEWRAKNSDMRKFFDEYENEPMYKGRTFKMCLLLIAQRLTKYPILFEQLLKIESATFKEETARAHAAVKAFAVRVDSELAKMEINRRWDRIRSRMDRSSVGRINQNDLFTFDDLTLAGSADQRNLLCIGGAQCHSTQQKPEEGVEVVLILFDDILVLLTTPSGKNDKYAFYDRGPTGCSVIALNTLMVRDMPRNTSVFLVVDLKPCFDLFVVTFSTKSHLQEWKRAIEAAKECAPVRVRRAQTAFNESTIAGLVEDPEEARFNAEMEEWEIRLKELFDKRKRDEQQLSVYVRKRLEWFDQVRQHVERIPVKYHSDAQRIAVSEKIKASVKEKFAELRAVRRATLNTVSECATRLSQEDFRSFFDDAYDASVVGSDFTAFSAFNESDENRLALPKRTRTFHGTALPHRGSTDNSIRRHTTEPQITDRRRLEEAIDAAVEVEKMRKLTLGLSSRARRAATRLIQECVELRVENRQHRSEIAMLELHLAALKTRRLAATPANALEALRKKQQELQDMELGLRSKFDLEKANMTELKEELSAKEKEIKAREEQVEEQWRKLYELNNPEVVSLHRPLGFPRPLHAAGPSFRSGSAINERASTGSPRSSQAGQLAKSVSNSSMPLHLAEKTSKISRTKKF